MTRPADDRSTHDPGLVSVITPCHDAAPFIAETIGSVRAQRHPMVEHIVVDDASTDGSWEVIRSFGDQVQAVRLERNMGAAHARNVGAALARGEYLMFLDADDLIREDALAELVAAVRDRRGSAAVCQWRRLVQGSGGAWRSVPAGIVYPPPPDALRGWLEQAWVPTCAVLWRRDVYHSTGGWDETLTLGDDGDLMMRALARGMRLVPADGGEAYYRSHGEGRLSLSQDVFQLRRLESQRRVLVKLHGHLDGLAHLERYRVPLGVAYRRLGLSALRHGHATFGRQCMERGRELSGSVAVSRTLHGRLLERLLGPALKEAMVSRMAELGIGTRLRRAQLVLKQRHDAGRATGDGRS